MLTRDEGRRTKIRRPTGSHVHCAQSQVFVIRLAQRFFVSTVSVRFWAYSLQAN